MTDLDATAAWAAGDGGNASALGVTGFCRGGRNTIVYAAHNPNLKAAVVWYGGNVVSPPTEFMTVRGSRRRRRSSARCSASTPATTLASRPTTSKQLEAALAKSGQKWEMTVYPSAKHGFLADYRPTYSAEASADAWPRCLAWFKTNGVGV